MNGEKMAEPYSDKSHGWDNRNLERQIAELAELLKKLDVNIDKRLDVMEAQGWQALVRAITDGFAKVALAIRAAGARPQIDDETLVRIYRGLTSNTRGIVEAQIEGGEQVSFNVRQKGGEKIMATPTGQEILEKITEQKTVVAGLDVYVDNLRAELKAAAAQNPLTPEQIQQIFDGISANTQAAADAMVENVE